MRCLLTNTAVAQAQPGDTLWDTLVPGLHLRVTEKGKVFYWYERKHGRQYRPKLGQYPALSLTGAREKARGAAQVRETGILPVGNTYRRTMNDLWAEAEEKHYNKDTAWCKEAKRLWETHWRSAVGNTRIIEVTPRVLDSLMRKWDRHPTQANRAMAVMSKLMKLAVLWGHIPAGTQPTPYVPRHKERSRDRYANADEARIIMRELTKLEKTNFRAAAFLWVLLYSGARPSEIERATWPQLHEHPDGSAVIRIEEGKTGRRRVVLPTQAMAVIRRLGTQATLRGLRSKGSKTLIFGIKMPRAHWRRIREAAGCPDLWARDLRRTFATIGLSRTQVPIGIVGELLDHKSTQTTKIYARLMNDSASLAAQSIANTIEGLPAEGA